MDLYETTPCYLNAICACKFELNLVPVRGCDRKTFRDLIFFRTHCIFRCAAKNDKTDIL